MSDFQVVDRPAARGFGKRHGVTEAIIATLDTDRSVRLAETGPAANAALSSIRWALRRRHPDLRVAIKTVGGAVHVWVERKRVVSETVQENRDQELVGTR